jgi:trehalose/maltose hydrolase-like predicted phosphorylase
MRHGVRWDDWHDPLPLETQIKMEDEAMSEWLVATDRFLTPYTPTFVADGYIGVVGDWLGLGRGDCQIADVYNRSSNPADTVRARLPAFSALDLHNGLRWLGGLEKNTTLVQSYGQELDLRTATLSTRFRWHDGDHDIDITSNMFVCRHQRGLVVQQFALTPHFDGPLELHAFVDERRGDLLIEQREYVELEARSEETKSFGDDMVRSWVLTVTPTQRDRTLAIATSLRFSGPGAAVQLLRADKTEQSGVLLRFEAQAGASYTLTRVVAVGEEQADAALARSRAALTSGYAALHTGHVSAWEELWQGAILIDGDDTIQHVVLMAQYGLLSSMRAGSGWSISPMGLSSRGYGGHIFWDADTWMFPGLLLSHPELAQGCVEYRCERLDGARAKARQYGYQGAMFPWEGDDLGVETTPDWAPCGRYEQHVTACVALAAWQWYQATKDADWLRQRGWPLLRDCADFWASRVTPTPDPANDDPALRYHILDVQPPDEYVLHVDDSAWTNASAARCMQRAMQAAALLGETALPVWGHVAERLHIPFDEERRIVLEYAGYTDDVIKQADVVLLTFPLEWPLPEDVVRNNARFYAERVDAAHGPAMTYAIHAILAAAEGDQEQLGRYLHLSYAQNLRPPFYSFSETPDQDYCTFVTGAGGLLQALIFGCCGARLNDDGLHFPHAALLPQGWRRLSVRLRCRGQHYHVEVTPEGRTVRATGSGGADNECDSRLQM